LDFGPDHPDMDAVTVLQRDPVSSRPQRDDSRVDLVAKG
jgi:hypothetical protein